MSNQRHFLALYSNPSIDRHGRSSCRGTGDHVEELPVVCTETVIIKLLID